MNGNTLFNNHLFVSKEYKTKTAQIILGGLFLYDNYLINSSIKEHKNPMSRLLALCLELGRGQQQPYPSDP